MNEQFVELPEHVVNPKGITHVNKTRERDNRATHVREYTQWTLNNWQHAQNLFRPMQSLDQLIYSDNPTPLGETLPGESNTENQAIANADFDLLLEGLTQKQKTVIKLRYGEDLTVNQISQVMGTSLGAVNDHEMRGLDKIRKKFGLPTKGKVYTDPQHRRDYQRNWCRKKTVRLKGMNGKGGENGKNL